jgi:hypothetical protein
MDSADRLRSAAKTGEETRPLASHSNQIGFGAFLVGVAAISKSAVM